MCSILNNIKNRKLLAVIGMALLISLNSNAQDNNYKKLMSLPFEWKFAIGDNSRWSSSEFNDSDWESIRVPGNWENQGFNGYDGFAWYRTNFEMDIKSTITPLYLSLGYIDDVDEVFINGTSIGKSGSFPPYYSTAYDAKRVYRIPINLLNSGSKNTIALRIYDEGGEGGIIHGDVAILIDIDAMPVDLNLQGNWKFQTGNCKIEDIKELDFSNWSDILVPGMWENQGYKDYDGYACYAIEFELNNQFLNESMVLALGRIDDFDQAYLNGKLVGQSINFNKDKTYQYANFYRQIRGYYLPADALNQQGKNVLLVKVLDIGINGGIYEGSVGLITQTNYIKYWKSRRNKVMY